MYYLIIIIAAALFSVQFVFNNSFRKEMNDSWITSLLFSLYTSLSGVIVLLLINKFHLNFSLFSLLTACVYSGICILLSYASIKAFSYANLSVYSVFAMIGGMALPFLYGYLSGEKITISQVICFIFIALSVLTTISSGRKNKKAIKYYLYVFILNGMVGVVSKFHQSYSDINVDSGSFMILTKIITVLCCVLLILVGDEKKFKVTLKAGIFSFLYSIINSVGNLLLLIALLKLPASVQYPAVTGGTIIFSVLFSLILKQKNSLMEYTGAVIALISTIFLIF